MKQDFNFTPFDQWEIVSHTWSTTTLQRVHHSLVVKDPREVRYLVVRTSVAADIHDNLDDATYYPTLPWTANSIVLRANAACTADLLLFIPRVASPTR